MRIGSYPKVISEKIMPQTISVLKNYTNMIEIGDKFFEHVRTVSPPSGTWFCVADARVEINQYGIRKLQIIALNYLHTEVGLFYKDKFLVHAKVQFVEKPENILTILNHEYIVQTINSSICNLCTDFLKDCTCRDEIISRQESYLTGSTVSLENVPKGMQPIIGMPEIWDTSDIFEEENKEDTITLFEHFIPVIHAVAINMKIKPKDAEKIARTIIDNNPKIAEEQLVLEIIKGCR